MRSDKHLLALMGAFGFLSGLPLSLTSFTLQMWFATLGMSVHAVGLTTSLGLPYTLKFLWSGVFDRPPPPGLLARFGRRRFWLLLVQPALACAAAGLALSDPGRRPGLTVLAALGVTFLSASQDILIDAWRIETFPERLGGAALASYVWGYRGAMLASSSGVLWLSTVWGWHAALMAVAALLAAGMAVTLVAPAPPFRAAPTHGTWRETVRAVFFDPLRDFLARRGAITVLCFVILFLLGKVFADGTAASLYKTLGFGRAAIGNANSLGLAGTLAGAAAGAWLVLRLGTLRALLVAGLAQAASLGLYLALLATGPLPAMLAVKITVENFCGAAADTAFLTYVSALCSAAYTATQYALLSSLAALAFHTVGGLAGYAAEALGFGPFYLATILASLPALALLLQIRRIPAGVPGQVLAARSPNPDGVVAEPGRSASS